VKRLTGLGRKIALRMSVVALVGIAISAVGSFVLYSWVFENYPDAVAPADAWIPQPIDYLAFAASGVIAIVIAVVVSVQLARRIVLPLTSLAESARRIAGGDLTARAIAGDRSLGETAELVDDFNAMAARLEALSTRMTTWNAAIAHELRTPVTILNGRLDGVADGLFVLDASLLAVLRNQVRGLARLIEDLRVVSLADSGHLDVQLELTDLAVVVGDLRALVDPMLTEGGFSPVWNLQPALFRCDATRIRQAVLALIENARRHATPGRLEICTAAEGAGATIAVADQGPGLDPGLSTEIFDPFRRGGEDRDGSGLGLAVVRVIAEAHGGSAHHRANATGGSTFEIVLDGDAPQSVRRPDPLIKSSGAASASTTHSG
jgi:two-component system sensor histidine kinase AdeS